MKRGHQSIDARPAGQLAKLAKGFAYMTAAIQVHPVDAAVDLTVKNGTERSPFL